MNPFDIYNATVPWNGCSDMRPWLIVDIRPNNLFGCFPIATHDYSNSGFFVDECHRFFPNTGLNHSCHIIYERIIDVHISMFSKQRGALIEDLLRDFRRDAGV